MYPITISETISEELAERLNNEINGDYDTMVELNEK